MKDFQKEWTLSPNGWRLAGENRLFNINDILSDEKKVALYNEQTARAEKAIRYYVSAIFIMPQKRDYFKVFEASVSL